MNRTKLTIQLHQKSRYTNFTEKCTNYWERMPQLITANLCLTKWTQNGELSGKRVPPSSDCTYNPLSLANVIWPTCVGNHVTNRQFCTPEAGSKQWTTPECTNKQSGTSLAKQSGTSLATAQSKQTTFTLTARLSCIKAAKKACPRQLRPDYL